MVLIIGAAYSGKRDTAQKIYHIQNFCQGGNAPFPDVLQANAVTEYHLLIRRLLTAGESPQEFTKRFLSQNSGAVILMDEIGAGIIPLEREERLWREECGICARLLASHAETVIRVICGIPQILKGELP